MAKYTGHKYTWTKPFTSQRHSWELRSVHGGVHFHVSLCKEYPPFAGLEFHSVYPRGDDAPHHMDCPITGGRCWHGGTGLYASETLWPQIETYLKYGDHEAVFRVLEHEAKRLEEYDPRWEAKADD